MNNFISKRQTLSIVWFDFSDDTERETKFKELVLENERNKQVLTARR